MKKIINSLIFFTFGLLTFSACEKWTRTEALTIVNQTLDSKNPALHKAYMASLRAYRQVEHPVLIAKFDNVEGAPSGRAQQVAYLPDSVDFVILTRPGKISEQTARDLVHVRTEKGIRTLFQLDLTRIQKQYEAMVDAELEAYKNLEDPSSATKPEDSPERMAKYAKEQLEPLFVAIEREKPDGICVSYTYMEPASFREERYAQVKAYQKELFDQVNQWIAANENALLFFEGVPGHVLCETPCVTKAAYTIIPAQSASSAHTLGYEVAKALNSGAGAPRDRVIVGVTVVDPLDAAATDGKFQGGISAIVGAAQWVVTPSSDFVKKGICVEHAQNDYFSPGRAYSQIGQAISIMNPSPVK